MIEHDALDVGLVFPPKRTKRTGCQTCAELRQRIRDESDDPGPARAALAAHAAERH